MQDSASRSATVRTLLLTLVAVIAFAANSVLCRLALGTGLLDAASFATVRVIAGAIVLSLLMLPRWRAHGRRPVDWLTVGTLFIYMVFFSFAYLSLSVGTGALVLFPTVQLTMFVSAMRSGESFPMLSWAGLLLAVAGLVYLVSPGLSAPDPLGALLMAIAGVAWGVYSLRGAGGSDPLEATANNFLYSVPLVLVVSLLFAGDLHLTWRGALWAIASGALASGLGYVVWYAALKGLTASRAATVQLSVPVIAAFGGVVLLAEPVTLRLLLASAAILGGVSMVLAQRARVKV
jgi:drug/metabolite transporter (DMT)-like permease